MSKARLENTDIPGNSVGSHAAYVRQLVSQAETLLGFERTLEQMFEDEMYVRGISIRFPEDDRPEYLAVVRVDGADGKQVAFHSAPTIMELIVGVAKRMSNKSMKYREDEYV